MNHKTDMQALAERLRLLLSGDAILAKSDFARATIEQAIAALASRPDAQESLASENVVKDSVHKVSQGPAQADEREAFAMWWKDISPSNFDYASALAGYLAASARVAAPQPAFEAVQAVLREVDPKWRERGEFDVKPQEQAIAAIRDLAAAAPQAEATQGVAISDQLMEDLILRGTAMWRIAPEEYLAAPSPDREQVGEATEAARIVKMWDDGFTQLAGSRAIDFLRDNASPSRECGEREGKVS